MGVSNAEAPVTAPRSEGLPRLGYVVNPGSFSTFALVGAASELCELVWIIDSAELEPSELRLLRRTGTILEVGGVQTGVAARSIEAAGLDGILCLADDKLRWTSEVAANLGLRFHSVETATALTDKLV